MKYFVGVLLLLPSIAQAADLCAVYSSAQNVSHKPSSDVNLNSFDYQVPEKIVLPISKDFAQELDVDLDMTSNLGVVEVYSDGRVVFDGQHVGKQAQSYCERTENEDGQDGAEAINSEPSEAKTEEE